MLEQLDNGNPDALYIGISWVISWKCETKFSYCCNGVWLDKPIRAHEADFYNVFRTDLHLKGEDYDPETEYIRPSHLDLDGSAIQADLNDLSDFVYETAYNKTIDQYNEARASMSTGCVARPFPGIECKGEYVKLGTPKDPVGPKPVFLDGGRLNKPLTESSGTSI